MSSKSYELRLRCLDITPDRYPIRKSSDHHLCAAYRSFSQLATSVIDFWHLDIHRMPLVI